jgi:hypothetical protein
MAVTHVTNGFVRDQLEAITAAPYITAIARLTRTDLHVSDDKMLAIRDHINIVIKAIVRAIIVRSVAVIQVEDLSNGEPA